MPRGVFKNPKERIRKIKLALTGKVLTEEHRKHQSESHMGIKRPPRSEEWCKKIGLGVKGKKKHNKYKHYPKKSKALMGSKHWNWQGGITPLVQQIRHCFKYRQWRSDIFTRDDFTCVLCGKRGGWIEADHYPKKFSDIFHENDIKTFEQALECEEFWNINNGRTLCRKCHNITKKLVHMIYQKVE